jgi:hypothetical protein
MKKIIGFSAFISASILSVAFAFAIIPTAHAQTATTPATPQPINCPVGFTCTSVPSTYIPSTNSPVSSGGGSSCYHWSAYLSIGSRGADVVALQVWLIANGFNIPLISQGTATRGYFGPSTATALRLYQQNIGLPATGVLDTQTRVSLNLRACATPTPPNSVNAIVASLDPSSPQASTVQISPTSVTNNVPLAVFDIKSQGGNSTLQSLQIGVNATLPYVLNQGLASALFSSVSIRANGQTYYGTFGGVGKDGIASFNNFSIPLPADSNVPITLYGSVNPSTNGSLDGSTASASLLLNSIVAIDQNYNTVPVSLSQGFVNGNTITFSSTGVQVSNTSATVGTETCNSASNPTECDYPVSFSFSLTAGNSPIYIAKTSSCPAGYGCLANPLQFSGDNTQIIIQTASVIPSTGDGSNYYYIAPGQTRQFTYSGVITNSNNYSSASTYTVQVSSISYGTSASNPSSNSITSGLQNLQVTVIFNGGSTPVCPVGYVCTPPGTPLSCPVGYICTPVAITSCPSGYTCYTEQPTTASSITIVSPNGGEMWVKGTTQYITWTGTTGSPNQTGDIKLEFAVPTCAQLGQPIRCMIAVRAPLTIASGVNLNSGSYAWNVGNSVPLAIPCSPFATSCPNQMTPIADGQYKIQICQTNVNSITQCDESNNYFTITSGTLPTPVCPSGYACYTVGGPTPVCPTGYTCTIVTVNCPPGYICSTSTPTITSNRSPVISGGTFPTSLTVGQRGTWTVNASDPQNGSLSYSVNWGDTSPCNLGATMCPASVASTAFTQSATFTHSYSKAGSYTATFEVKDAAGLTAQTSATVRVGNVTPPTPVCPAGYICTPPNQTTTCPSGYTCTNTTSNCPPSYTCYTQTQNVTTPTPVCPAGYICTPPNQTTTCPAGYTCTNQTANCPPSYTCYTHRPITTPVSTKPSITVVSPNGREVYSIGKIIPVTWKYSGNIPTSWAQDNVGNPQVIIDLYRGNGVFVKNLTSTYGGVPSYPFDITSDIQPGNDYKIRVWTYSDQGYMDESNNYFTITSATPTPVCPAGYICTPPNRHTTCPAGFTCTNVTSNCPTGFICSTQTSATTTTSITSAILNAIQQYFAGK